MGSGGTQWDDQDVLTLARMNQKSVYIGPSAPSTTYSGMLWFNTSTNYLYERNAANDAWLQIYPVSGSVNIKQVELDFGATPLAEKVFSFADAEALTTTQIIGSVALEAPTGKDLDEVYMDAIEVKCSCLADGTVTIMLKGLEGYLADKFKINYVIG